MSQQEPNALNLASGTVIQGYRIESVLGKGGFAITYLATDLDLAKKVVLKELLPDGIATRIDGHTVVTQTPAQQDDFKWAVDSFLNEAKTLATFEHPNIVRVSRLFKENGTAYIVMPFIQGQTLKSIIKSSAPLPQARIVEMLLPLLKGLEVVHRSDVLHRDIKPDNIFITEEGVPVLIDFGAARQQVGGKSMDITSVITPGYAPIEQYSTDSKFQGPWSDIYAMAAVVHEMATGIKPAPASDRNDALRHQKPDPIKPFSQVADHSFSHEFIQAIERGLQLSESLRPQSISEWISAMGVDSQTVSYPPAHAAHAVNQPPAHLTGAAAGGPLSQTNSAHSGQHSGTVSSVPTSGQVRPPQAVGKSKKTALIAVCLLLVCAVGGFLLIFFGSNGDDDEKNKSTDNSENVDGAVGIAAVPDAEGANSEPQKPAPSEELTMTFSPVLTFEGGEVTSDCYALLKKYLRPKNDRIPWDVEVKGKQLIVKTSKTAPSPLPTLLRVPHMEQVSLSLQNGQSPQWDLALESREVLVYQSPGIKGLDIKLSSRQTQDADVIKLINLRPTKPCKTQPVSGQPRLVAATIPHLSSTLEIDGPGGKWTRSVPRECRYLVLGEKKVNSSGIDDEQISKAEVGDILSQKNLILDYYDIGAFKYAAGWAHIGAYRKNEVCLYNLGLFYKEGKGVEPSIEQAEKLLKKSAQLGYHDAQHALGLIYSNRADASKEGPRRTKRTEQSNALNQTALNWMETSAAAGHIPSLSLSGYILYNEMSDAYLGGDVMDAYTKKAESYWKRGAELGDPGSNFDLGGLYSDYKQDDRSAFYYKNAILASRKKGKGKSQFESLSLAALRKLANAGNANAKKYLAEL